MSIRDEIRLACKEERLFFVPLSAGGRPVRQVFAEPDLWNVIKSPWLGDDEDSLRLANMRAGIDYFSMGRRVTIAMRPHTKKKESFLAPLDPVSSDCWDMRFLAPHANIRALGFFAEFNSFVALSWDFRENFEGETDWSEAIRHCRDRWSQLFTFPPHRGSQLSDYISRPFDAG